MIKVYSTIRLQDSPLLKNFPRGKLGDLPFDWLIIVFVKKSEDLGFISKQRGLETNDGFYGNLNHL